MVAPGDQWRQEEQPSRSAWQALVAPSHPIQVGAHPDHTVRRGAIFSCKVVGHGRRGGVRDEAQPGGHGTTGWRWQQQQYQSQQWWRWWWDSFGAADPGGQGPVRHRCGAAALFKRKVGSDYRKMQSLEDGGGASPSVSAIISTQTPTRLERIRHKLLTIFRTVYPYLSMTTEGASLAYQFLYLAGMTGYYSPSMHVLGVLTRRITRADLQHQQQHHHQQGKQHVQQQSRARSAAKLSHSHANGTVPPADSSVRGMMESGSKSSPVPSGIGTAVMSSLQSGKADHVVRAIRTAIIVGGSTLLVTGWVAHFREELRQRRRRWIAGEDGTTDHDSENLQQRQQRLQGRQGVNTIGANRNIWTEQSNPIPPPHPPTLLDESESEYVRRGLPTDTSSCPICHRRRVNPAASTSGHVFCYRCLVMHLRSHGERCPLTGMHCPESRVIRLFEPTATGTAGAEMPSDGRNRKEEVGKEQGAGQSTGFDR